MKITLPFFPFRSWASGAITVLGWCLGSTFAPCYAAPTQYTFLDFNLPPGSFAGGTLFFDPADPSLGVLPGSDIFIHGPARHNTFVNDTFDIPTGSSVVFGTNGDPVVLNYIIDSALSVYLPPFNPLPEYDVLTLNYGTINGDQQWVDVPPPNDPNGLLSMGDGYWLPVNGASSAPDTTCTVALLVFSFAALGLAGRRLKTRSV